MNTDSLYATAVNERYRVLRRALQVARSRPDWGLRKEQLDAIRAEIRALVRVRWFVRRAMRAHRQPVNVGYHDWQAWDARKAEYDSLQLADVR
jgi:hypothetical protein